MHTLTNIRKVVSGMDAESLDEIAHVYEIVVAAGVHRASCIKVAEAAKELDYMVPHQDCWILNAESAIKMTIEF